MGMVRIDSPRKSSLIGEMTTIERWAIISANSSVENIHTMAVAFETHAEALAHMEGIKTVGSWCILYQKVELREIFKVEAVVSQVK